MIKIEEIQATIEEAIKDIHYGKPQGLYDPIKYTVEQPGKRIRPVLVVLANCIYNQSIKEAIHPAVAAEVFHNFTLIHDDLMDHAAIRRGLPTVHKKWDNNTSILSGDVMLIKAYELLEKSEENILGLLFKTFNQCAREVCEGQQYDMDFETRNDVSKEEYLTMIKLKTSVLIATSLKIGAIIGGASSKQQTLLYTIGLNIGLGFQLKDDLLDCFADEEKFGKKIGGDILNNKKTYLLIRTFEKSNDEQGREIASWLAKEDSPTEKIAFFKNLYLELGVKEETEILAEQYFNQAFEDMKLLEGDKDAIALIERLFINLINREK